MACFSLLPFLSHGLFPTGPISTQVSFQANALVFGDGEGPTALPGGIFK